MKHYLLSIVSIFSAFGITLWFYPQLPAEVAIHWDVNGQVDGFTGKPFIFLLPAFMAIFLLLKILMPKIDPKKENYKQFSTSYHLTTEIVMAFLLVLQFAMLLYNANYNVNMEKIVFLSVGCLFVIVGNYLPKVKHNYFIGIRTPWTLANETVWQKTHRLGGKLFVLTGFVMIIGTFLPVAKGWILVVVTLLSVFSLVGSSYYYFNQVKNEG